MADKLYIGWSEADITPVTDKFIALSGQYYERLTKEIHSRLKTVAVAFSCGDEQFITASMDNGGMQKPFHDYVCKLAHEMERNPHPFGAWRADAGQQVRRYEGEYSPRRVVKKGVR